MPIFKLTPLFAILSAAFLPHALPAQTAESEMRYEVSFYGCEKTGSGSDEFFKKGEDEILKAVKKDFGKFAEKLFAQPVIIAKGAQSGSSRILSPSGMPLYPDMQGKAPGDGMKFPRFKSDVALKLEGGDVAITIDCDLNEGFPAGYKGGFLVSKDALGTPMPLASFVSDRGDGTRDYKALFMVLKKVSD